MNCRPWIGNVDRTDPWSTPDLSSSIEVRVIDLCTLKDTGIRYLGHKGYSPSTMCCFVFLDVSEDYVGRYVLLPNTLFDIESCYVYLMKKQVMHIKFNIYVLGSRK